VNKVVQGFKELFAATKNTFEYFLEGAKLSFMEEVVARMSDLKLSKSDLAHKLNCNPSYVTKILRGSANFTLESMVKIGLALESEVDVRLRPKNCQEDWSKALYSRLTLTKPKNLLGQYPNSRINFFNLSPPLSQPNRIQFNEQSSSQFFVTDPTPELNLY
jgi:transcriptional regulator with XRE-family HTH domain